MPATLVQLNTSKGGMPKLANLQAIVTPDGVGEDWQLNRKYHGGPDRAVCLYSVELYQWLRDQHQIDLQHGDLGENFTTQGVDLDNLNPGDRLTIGACTIEITEPRKPCVSLHKWHPNLMKVMKGHSGWLAKVIESAVVRPGDPIEKL